MYIHVVIVIGMCSGCSCRIFSYHNNITLSPFSLHTKRTQCKTFIRKYKVLIHNIQTVHSLCCVAVPKSQKGFQELCWVQVGPFLIKSKIYISTSYLPTLCIYLMYWQIINELFLEEKNKLQTWVLKGIYLCSIRIKVSIYYRNIDIRYIFKNSKLQSPKKWNFSFHQEIITKHTYSYSWMYMFFLKKT